MPFLKIRNPPAKITASIFFTKSESFVAELLSELGAGVKYIVVNEAGASVYSASKLAAEEFPEFDVMQRSAVSIARRLQDPLAELVKIDPKAIGVGQYQHDMKQNRLTEALDGVVEDCVNSVGVDLNTASYSLLSHIAGINATAAKNIVKYREENGEFTSRAQILKVPRIGAKAYEQCAGFLRVPGGREVLDNTGVHPESYAAARGLLGKFGYDESEIRTGGVKLLGSKVAKVQIVCHDWYKKSTDYPTNSNKVSVNGSEAVLAPYNEEGTFGTLTFDLATASETVTIDTNLRVFIQKIIVTFADASGDDNQGGGNTGSGDDNQGGNTGDDNQGGTGDDNQGNTGDTTPPVGTAYKLALVQATLNKTFYFKGVMDRAQAGWRRVCAASVMSGIPVPAMTTALNYYDGYRTARLPANLLQAQRDYFGAHTYERTDCPRGEFYHTNWTGEGGNTSASTYVV